MKTPELPPFQHQPKKYSGPSADEVLRLRKEFLNPGIFLSYKNNYEVISLRNAYHGGSTLTMGMTGNRGWKFNVPHSFGVHHAITPDPYRGLWGRDDVDAGKKYAADVKNLVDFATPGQVAAFIAESIQGVGGCVVFPDGYLKHAYEHVRAAGGLC